MERRSTRGRHPQVDEPASPVAAIASPMATNTIPADMVPEVGVEEVVLNRRGMPQRQRKRNRFYYDDDTMVTPEAEKPRKSLSKSPVKKLKHDDDVPRRRHEEEPRSKGDTSRSAPGKSNSTLARQSRGEASPQRQPRTPLSQQKSSNQVKIKKEPETPPPRGSRNREPEPESPRRPSIPKVRQTASPTRAIPKPIQIKKDPDAPEVPTPTPRTSRRDKDEDRSVEKPREKTPRVRPAVERVREREDKESKRERERQKEKEYQTTPVTGRRRRGSSPTQFPLTHATLPPDTPMEIARPAIDKKTAQDISLRLRNVLKLPKAHKWVCYEWFYSNIDKVLFEGENDFQICLKESFPTLKARKCTRVEWCKVRRMMGKPRRCSQAFFDEEREELARRRQKIRMIQQRKVTDFNYKELPDEIPLQLVIGTKVTARLRRPQDGLFTGTIEGVDTSNNTYRITFDRSGLGTHSIPDYEVLSNDNPETVSTSSFALKIPRRSFGGFAGGNFKINSVALLSGDDSSGGMPKSPFPVDGMLGGFPIRLLDMIVRLSKLLKAKREKIVQLKELNVEAEKMYSYSKNVNNDYRMRYARCVLDLDSMNKEMSMYLEGIQQYCLDIAPDHGSNQMIVPEHVQEQCRNEANLIVDTYNAKQNRTLLHNPKNLALISQLTSMLLQIKTLGNGERNLYELKSIKDTVKDVKASLEGRNVVLFQNRVEIPLNQIQAGMCGPSYASKTAF